jgi:hypothetical protein
MFRFLPETCPEAMIGAWGRAVSRAGASARSQDCAVSMPKLLIAFAMGLAAWPANAQTIGNVNDCTLLTDPVALRRCVDSFSGRIQRPSDQLLSPPADVARPPVEGQPMIAPEPIPPKRATSPRSKDWLPEASKPGSRIQSNPNSILFDR